MSISYSWQRILACVVLFVVLGILMLSLVDAAPASIDVSYYKGEHSNDTIPDMIEAGKTYPVTITFRNTGMVSWDWGVEKFGLLYQGLQSSILVDPVFSRLGKDTEIKPGDDITFPLILTPPEKPGDYTISFSMATLKGDSYNTFPETFSKTVKVISEDGISSGSVGSIIVSSIPTGSQVLIGGDVRGNTPLTIPDLRPAMYDLSVASPDYQTKAVQVTVEAGSVSRLRVDLTSSNKTDISIEKDERYTLLGFLKENLPLLILTIAILFFGLQMLMMDTKRFPENHPVRLFVRPITIVPVSFDGKVSSRKSSKKGSTSGSENSGTGADEHGFRKGDSSATRTTGQTQSRSKELKDKKPGYGDEQKSKKNLKGENADELKVPDVDQQYQDISNPFGFPDGLKDRYEPLGVAGDDSYARVFKVRKKDNGSIRALKVSHMKNAGSEILQKEASVWGNIRHPNVVRLYKAEFDDDLSFLDLEFLDGIKYRGGSLTSLSALPKPIREKYAVSLIRDVANGLKYTHSLGIRHYHLQTGDVLLTHKMQAKISGYARGKNELGFSVPESDTREAPAAYLAPEQRDEAIFGNPGRKTDIYQLGVIFYELLTGFLPYSRSAADKASVEWHESGGNRLILPSELKSELSKYDMILSRMLATDKKKRYALVDEFLADLDIATAP
ncbi:protein kinase domain-containing protein [Methanospirillum lacunae]|uniref:Protein kinase domain-containing protein n=1 Tax=Methanospirillum lacunae TaxID=668570 RepID=A0A2V2MXN4_9EURY|nr:protein kinase [Methanospirillum lacunae]PWR71000.1 hypothetical protein DK846_13560 [Methanospirillum lacunae]